MRMGASDKSLLDLEGATHLRPLAGFALITLCAFTINPNESDWLYVAVACLIFALGASIAWIGAKRAGWVGIAPAIAALAAIAALRESQGGASSGYSPLAVLAVVWVALMLDRRAVVLITACTGLMFALPLTLIGGSAYPSTGWRGAILFTFVALVVGEVVHRSVTRMRAQAVEAESRSEELEEMQRAFAAIRRTWDEAISNAMRDGSPLCVAMIDLDHFKQFNDEHGHAAGDRLLKAGAAAWRSHLRVEDTLARIGGEEFAVLLPKCSLAQASDVLERLRRATPSGATASVGVTEIQPGEDANSVLARADAALYEAKTAGRDQLLAAA